MVLNSQIKHEKEKENKKPAIVSNLKPKGTFEFYNITLYS